jgi:hypothetical protein
MSALGQKRTYAVQKAMSALPPKADMCGATRDVCFGPIADSRSAAKRSLFDHLIGACEQRRRHGDAECPGCFEIKEELDPSPQD